MRGHVGLPPPPNARIAQRVGTRAERLSLWRRVASRRSGAAATTMGLGAEGERCHRGSGPCSGAGCGAGIWSRCDSTWRDHQPRPWLLRQLRLRRASSSGGCERAGGSRHPRSLPDEFSALFPRAREAAQGLARAAHDHRRSRHAARVGGVAALSAEQPCRGSSAC